MTLGRLARIIVWSALALPTVARLSSAGEVACDLPGESAVYVHNEPLLFPREAVFDAAILVLMQLGLICVIDETSGTVATHDLEARVTGDGKDRASLRLSLGIEFQPFEEPDRRAVAIVVAGMIRRQARAFVEETRGP